MNVLNTVVNNIAEQLDKTSKRTALDNANIQPKLSVIAPITKTTSTDKETDTIDVTTDSLSSDDTTIAISDNLLISVVKDYVLASQLSTKQVKLTSVGPNISLTGTVLDGIDSVYESGKSITIDGDDGTVSADLPTTSKIGTVKIGAGLTLTNGVISVSNLYYGVRTAKVSDSALTSTTTPNKTSKAGTQLYASLSGNEFILYGGLNFSTASSSSAGPLVVGLSNSSSSLVDLSLKVTKSSATIGSSTTPVYMSSGEIVASNANVGSALHPITMVDGTFVKCTSDGAKNKTLYIDDGVLQNSMHSDGIQCGLYLDKGTISACLPTYTMFYTDKTSPTAAIIGHTTALALQGDRTAITISTTPSVTDTNSVVETAMDNGVTTFYFRVTYNTETVTTPDFPEMIIGIPIDHMKQGVIYTYSFSFPDKVFITSGTGYDMKYRGNVLSHNAYLKYRFYTSNTLTKEFKEKRTYSVETYNARAIFYGFDALGTMYLPSVGGKLLLEDSSVDVTLRRGDHTSDSYCGDHCAYMPTSVSFMRGPNINPGVPTLMLVGVSQNNT